MIKENVNGFNMLVTYGDEKDVPSIVVQFVEL